MATVTMKTPAGKAAGKVELDDAVFGIRPNVVLMHQVVTAQLANRRAGTQSTKTRAEVRGGGAKPYRQKGTGNARQGSTNSPHYTGGGVAHGPKPRSYRQRTPKKMVRLALLSALSDRAADDKIVVVDEWSFDAPRTKEAVAALGALGVDGKVLVVLTRDEVNAALSFRNLTHVHLVEAGQLNAYDVLNNDWIVFSRASLPGTAAGAPEPDEAEDADPIQPVRIADAAPAEGAREAADDEAQLVEHAEDAAEGERAVDDDEPDVVEDVDAGDEEEEEKQ